jgi:uncharacterized protein
MTVFLDTAVFMYSGGADHPLREPCRQVLQEVVEGKLEAVTSAEVVQEILHRFLAIRRSEVGVAMARSVLEAFEPVLPISHAVIRRVPGLVERYSSLAARDLIHVATCLEEGIGIIVSPDAGFDRVSEVSRLDPAAVP